MKWRNFADLYIRNLFPSDKDDAVGGRGCCGSEKTHKELSGELPYQSNEKAIQYVASNMIKRPLRLQSHLTTDQARHGHRNYWMD